MAVTHQIPKISYTASGSAVNFSFPFLVLQQNDLQVYINGVQVTSGFTVDGLGVGTGGAVTFTTPPSAGAKVTLIRVLALERSTDYVEGGALSSSVLDNDFDRIVLMVQDVRADSISAIEFEVAAETALTAANTAIANANTSTTAAATATTQASSASASASAAYASQVASAASESTASAAATTATTKASEASASEATASAAATTATTQAGIATTKASEAAASASSASTSATTATTQAGIATTQATNASASAASIESFRGSPVSTTTGTLVIGDRSKTVSLSAGITVPANVFAAGDIVSLYNNTAGSLTVTQGSGLTLRQVATSNTGNRTLAQRSLVSIWFLSTTEAIIAGGGLA